MYYIQICVLAAINCLLALSAYISYSSGRLVVCLGAFMSVGGIACASLYALGLPFALALFLGGVAGAAFGAAVGIVCYQLNGFTFAVTTLGIGELARIVATNSDSLGGALGYSHVRVDVSPAYALVTLVVFMFLFRRFDRSPVRKAFLVLRENEILAAGVGIDIFRHRLFAIAASGFVSAVAGGLYIHTVGILDPKMFGFENSVQILVYTIVGGIGNFVWPITSAFGLTVLTEALRFAPPLRMILYGTSLVLAAVVRSGAFGHRSARCPQA